MKVTRLVFAAVGVLICGIFLGVTGARSTDDGHHLVAEGNVSFAMFRDVDGKTSGWTAIDSAKAVPGGNGRWNEHRYAKLYDNFLVVTKPSDEDFGQLIIPTNQLLQIQFAGQ
jgi:hypothetical protein